MEIIKDKQGLFTIETSFKKIETPFFFPAISTIKTNYSIKDYFQLLVKLSYPGILISSYDLYNNVEKETLFKEISRVSDGKTFTFMDSGNYEAFWNADQNWSFVKFEKILKSVNTDFCFSFDGFWKEGKNVKEHIKEIITLTAKTASLQSYGITIPIIHSDLKNMNDIIEGVVKGLYPQVVGIPERELGASLFERAQMIAKIKKRLKAIGQDIPLHVLGTGNPQSLLIYSLCGADLYDGLEWCNTVVNPQNAHLHHFIQKELFKCDCRACKVKMPYHLQAMSHNLIFYQRFMQEIRNAISQKKTTQLIKKYLPNHIHSMTKKVAGLK